MQEITSKNNFKIKEACSLKIKKYRQEKGLFLMEGIKNLDMALKFGEVVEIFSAIDLPKLDKNIEIFKVNQDVIKKLAVSENPEGVVFTCRFIKRKRDVSSYHHILYLDRINDPGNLGTIIRTASAFNFDAVILSEGSVDLYNEKTLAASKGSIFLIDAFYDDIDSYIKGREVIVSYLDEATIPLSSYEKPDNYILVLGNESHGVSDEIVKKATALVKIEMNSNIDSLNVAIAGAILMNHLK